MTKLCKDCCYCEDMIYIISGSPVIETETIFDSIEDGPCGYYSKVKL